MEKQRDVFGKILGALFMLSSLPKLLGAEQAVANFNTWHLSGWRYVVGAIELFCGVLMFFAATKKYGAFGFFCIMPAAAIVHITASQYSNLPVPIILGCVVLAYLRREKAVQLFP